MGILNFSHVSMGFGERTLFEDVSLEIGGGDKVGFVGVNGAGKTTLFKLITGEYTPVSGELFVSKQARLGYMEQHVCTDSQRTLYDEMESVFAPLRQMEAELEETARRIDAKDGDIDALIERQLALQHAYEQAGGLTYQSRTRAALTGLGFAARDFSLPVSKLSGGQKSKVSLGKLLLSGANLLLLDEPTNHLDIDSVEWLEGFLRDFSGAAVIISHDRYFLDRVTGRTIELEHGRIAAYRGGYSAYLSFKKEQEEIARRHYDNAMREIHRVEGIIAQQRQWNREKNIRTAESKEKLLQRMQAELEKPDEAPDAISFTFQTSLQSGNDVLDAQELAKGFGEKPLFRHASFQLKRGERAFLLGANGCGKTTLLRVLTGEYTADEGDFQFGTNVKLGYFDQTLSGLSPEKTVLDEVWDVYPQLSTTQVRSALALFLFCGDDVYKKIEALSGGERARVALLKLMLSGANLLLLDEPTNHLDIHSREALEQALLQYDGTLLVVSHDRYFINRLATRILHLTPEGLSSYPGGYDDYLLKKQAADLEQTEERQANEPPKQNDYRARKERESEKRRLSGAIRRCEAEVERLDGEIAAQNERLALPEIAADYTSVMEITDGLHALQKEQEALLTQWETMQLRLEELESLPVVNKACH